MRVLDWDDFIAGAAAAMPLNLSIGVFDGVHRGHQALIREICSSPAAAPAVVTFTRNPLQILKPRAFPGNIYSLRRRLSLFSGLGVKLTVLIDFSEKFSKLGGTEFISLLLRSCRMERLVVGRNFRCGHGLDTDIARIRELPGAALDITAIDPVTEGGGPISSSRIRAAIAVGDYAEAALLMGRNPEIDLAGLPLTINTSGDMSYDVRAARRILPPDGVYRVRVHGCGPVKNPDTDSLTETREAETTVSVTNGRIIVPGADDGEFNPQRLELIPVR